MNVTLNFVVDRITINEESLTLSITLEKLFDKLSRITHNVRINYARRTIEIRFEENDMDNLEEGYEQKVIKVIQEYTTEITLPVYTTSEITLKADFAPAS